ncbi:MAG: hypothetical protein WCL28_12950 [bacterium]
MSINLNSKGISRLAMILAAGLSVACGEIKLQGPEVTEATAELDGHGTLKLTSEQFPEGAETLILSVLDVGGNSHRCGPVFPLPEAVPAAGLGLQTIAKPDWKHCVPVLEESHDAQQVVEEHVVGAGRVIQIKRGEEIAPIRLPAGSYQAIADFSDKSGQPLYTGTEFFEIQDGEQKALTIRLKKIASGEVTIGFEIEKPKVLPSKISDDAHVELRKSVVFGKHVEVDTNIDLDLAQGMAVVSYGCSKGSGYACKERTIKLSKDHLLKLKSILQTVSLKGGKEGGATMCADPIESISLVLKRCKECEAGAVHKFFNSGCGQPFHTLSSAQFSKIEGILSNLPGKLVVQAAR